MLQWFGENLATIVICLVLLAVIALVLIKMVKNKKQGRSSCGCGCSNCPMSASCHGNNGKEQENRS